MHSLEKVGNFNFSKSYLNNSAMIKIYRKSWKINYFYTIIKMDDMINSIHMTYEVFEYFWFGREKMDFLPFFVTANPKILA